MRNRGVEIAKLVTPELESSMNPLYLWADDAVYNARHEKIMTILLGHVSDEKTYSIQTCWPLCTIRVASCLKTHHVLFVFFVWEPIMCFLPPAST